MPFVREPHFCQPPLWPRLQRLDTVWKCPLCGALYKVERGPYSHDKKKWVLLKKSVG